MNTVRLKTFILSFTQLIDNTVNESLLLAEGGKLLSHLIKHDDWLPTEFARPHSEQCQQYLLDRDPDDRFSVVSFVWGPGQKTPIHDHTVWGMIGVLRGAENCVEYAVLSDAAQLKSVAQHRLEAGEVDFVSPHIGDIHTVSNAFTDRVSISIHVYGANIGVVNRFIYDLATGEKRPLISGYSNLDSEVLV